MEMQVLEISTESIDKYRRIDRRLVTLEAMSAECGALLAKVSIKQYNGKGCVDIPSLNCSHSRNLLSV